jgi:hypothetical protein
MDAGADVQVQRRPGSDRSGLDEPGAADAARTEAPKAAVAKGGRQTAPVVDVNVLFQEGPQYFVRRITFTGNNTTRDNVIAARCGCTKGSVFDSEALKFSVRRSTSSATSPEIPRRRPDTEDRQEHRSGEHRRRDDAAVGAEPESD